MESTTQELRAKRQIYYRTWLAKKNATPESAEAYRNHRNKHARDYQRKKRLDDPVWRDKVNARSNHRYHTKIKPKITDEDRVHSRDKQRQYRRQARIAIKLKLQQMLGGKCAVCGITDPRLLDFDHIDPLQKTMLISQAIGMRRPFEELEAEARKCQLLCPNCHRIKNIEQSQLNSYIRENREYRNKNRTHFSAPILSPPQTPA